LAVLLAPLAASASASAHTYGCANKESVRSVRVSVQARQEARWRHYHLGPHTEACSEADYLIAHVDPQSGRHLRERFADGGSYSCVSRRVQRGDAYRCMLILQPGSPQFTGEAVSVRFTAKQADAHSSEA
jgi:hypothetical protein